MPFGRTEVKQVESGATIARQVVEKNFPGLWPVVEACSAAIATLCIDDIKDPASIVLQGPASSSKGTALDFFRGHNSTYWSDKFTPASFVSQAANKSEEELRKIDLLPRIKNKALIVPELAPILNTRSDVLQLNIATLVRVFDGQGYMVDAGTGGRRGYPGEYRFTFLGATTPLPDRTWRVLGKLGNRLCVLNMPAPNPSSDFAAELLSDMAYKEKVEECRIAVEELLDHLETLKPVKWDRKRDPVEVVAKIVKLAELSGKLRGYIPKVRVERGSYERGFPEVEEEKRFATLLYNLARGRALVSSRNHIDESDLELVREVALSSCSYGRYRLMKFLTKRVRGEIDTAVVEELLGCSKPYALELMEELEILGVVSRFDKNLRQGGRVKTVKIVDEYRSLLLPSSRPSGIRNSTHVP